MSRSLALGVAFVVGAAMLLWGLFSWNSARSGYGLWLAGIGFFAGGAAALYKMHWEHNAQRKLETGLRQLEVLRRERKQLHDEREELDIELPSGGGPLAVRLQAAERELGMLEQLLSADAKRSASIHDIAAAEQPPEREPDEARLRLRLRDARGRDCHARLFAADSACSRRASHASRTCSSRVPVAPMAMRMV